MSKEGQINNTTKGISGRAKDIMEQEVNDIRKSEQCMMEERQSRTGRWCVNRHFLGYP